jgi:hypothetical protein
VICFDRRGNWWGEARNFENHHPTSGQIILDICSPLDIFGANHFCADVWERKKAAGVFGSNKESTNWARAS